VLSYNYYRKLIQHYINYNTFKTNQISVTVFCKLLIIIMCFKPTKRGGPKFFCLQTKVIVLPKLTRAPMVPPKNKHL